jgi:hypothetical protein
VSEGETRRAEIPCYFQEALRGEVGFRCGLCGSDYAAEFAHIIPWETCHNNHPWNLLSLCVKCHKGYDREKRISSDEIHRAKERVHATLVEELKFAVSEERMLHFLKSIRVQINETEVTGIDFLLSTIVAGSPNCVIEKCRIVAMLALVGNRQLDQDPQTVLGRLSELSSMHLSHSRISQPFWYEFVESLHGRELFPTVVLNLNRAGVEVLTYLHDHADEFIDVAKYTGIGANAATDVIRGVIQHCNEESKRVYRRDVLENLDLNSYMV